MGASDGSRSSDDRTHDSPRRCARRQLCPVSTAQADAGTTNLDDWRDGPAKYLTYGSGEDEAYGAGVTRKLGPANLERNGDGSIVIDGGPRPYVTAVRRPVWM